jgi:hypothetical protein
MTLYHRVSTWSKEHPVFWAFLLGASIGFIASAVYLVSGGDTFLLVPTWANVVFFPGFLAGDLAYGVIGLPGAAFIGILAIGLSYGLIAMFINQLLRLNRKRSKSSTVNDCI